MTAAIGSISSFETDLNCIHLFCFRLEELAADIWLQHEMEQDEVLKWACRQVRENKATVLALRKECREMKLDDASALKIESMRAQLKAVQAAASKTELALCFHGAQVRESVKAFYEKRNKI